MKAKTTKKPKAASMTPDWTIEEQLCRLRRRMQMMKIVFAAHAHLGEGDGEELIAGVEEMLEDCLVQVDQISEAPASVMNWSPSNGEAR